MRGKRPETCVWAPPSFCLDASLTVVGGVNPPRLNDDGRAAAQSPELPESQGPSVSLRRECQDLTDCGTDKSAGPRAGHALRSGADGRPGQTLLQPVPKSAHESGSTEPNEPQLI